MQKETLLFLTHSLGFFKCHYVVYKISNINFQTILTREHFV